MVISSASLLCVDGANVVNCRGGGGGNPPQTETEMDAAIWWWFEGVHITHMLSPLPLSLHHSHHTLPSPSHSI